LRQGDSLEISQARTEFRRLIHAVVITPGADRGSFEMVVESEMAALIAQDGHIVTVGAGTRTTRCDTPSFLIHIDAPYI